MNKVKLFIQMRDRLLDLETVEMFPILLEYIEKYTHQLVSAYFPEEVPEEDQERKLDKFIQELSLVFTSLDWQEEDVAKLDRVAVEEKSACCI